MAFQILTWLLIGCYIISRYFKLTDHSLVFSLKDGLNPQRRLSPLLFFSHYLFIRLLISLFIGISEDASSKVLWIIMLVFQVFITFSYLWRIYHELLA